MLQALSKRMECAQGVCLPAQLPRWEDVHNTQQELHNTLDVLHGRNTRHSTRPELHITQAVLYECNPSCITELQSKTANPGSVPKCPGGRMLTMQHNLLRFNQGWLQILHFVDFMHFEISHAIAMIQVVLLAPPPPCSVMKIGLQTSQPETLSIDI